MVILQLFQQIMIDIQVFQDMKEIDELFQEVLEHIKMTQIGTIVRKFYTAMVGFYIFVIEIKIKGETWNTC